MKEAESIQQPFTVSGLTKAIRQRIEENFEWIEVRGEISNFKKAPSGHAYFRMKDADAVLECVAWRNTVIRWAGIDLRDGDEVIAGGGVTVYPPRGQYQFVVSAIRLAGFGVLQQRFEQLKRKLLDEGLFDSERKQSLPSFPQKIAVITSPTGAAVRDFLRSISQNHCPIDVTVYPVLVQGTEAAGEISAAIRAVNQREDYDLIVLCRGGGSLEDLWTFNEEIVVRAIAESRIPVVTGIGHEIDFTLADFAADRRASTPTGAAETIAGLFEKHRGQLRLLIDRLIRSTLPFLAREKERLAVTKRGFKRYHPKIMVSDYRQRLDEFSLMLLTAYRQMIIRNRDVVRNMSRMLFQTTRYGVESKNRDLKRIASLMSSYDPARNLARGYAICRHNDGRPIVRVSDAEKDDRIDVIVSNGLFRTQVLEKSQTNERNQEKID